MDAMAGYRFRDFLSEEIAAATLRQEVREGLSAQPKWLSPKWLYDERGSSLFERITALPEYYLTRAEREILRARSDGIASSAGCDTLIELGSGSSDKTRMILTALTLRRPAIRYVALDISESALREAATALGREYPQLSIDAIRADYETQLEVLPSGGSRLVAFLGGTIGNFKPVQRMAFLARLRALLDKNDRFLLTADMVKSPEILLPAYRDAAGLTAAFNRNVLSALNRILGGNFRPEDFEHRAIWNSEDEWIEMRLRANRALTANVAALDMSVTFDKGEEVRTEISSKFRRDKLEAECQAAGFALDNWWTDGAERYSLSLWSPA
jgi:L-histidine Nalpha-methyltransferase